VSEFYIIPRSTVENTVRLLESLESPSPIDFFVYLEILKSLKEAVRKIDIQLKISENVYVDGNFRCCGVSEFPMRVSQTGSAVVIPLSSVIF